MFLEVPDSPEVPEIPEIPVFPDSPDNPDNPEPPDNPVNLTIPVFRSSAACSEVLFRRCDKCTA